jgi:isopentenyl diphosphate isomerase/L-lactate dehydrogenase-like FMN-dependent dehydrogenase
LAGAVRWSGDVALARAAESAGIRAVLSSASAYPWRNTALVDSLISRAGEAGYSTLVVTVDVPVKGNRLPERRVGMSIPPTLTPAQVWSAARRPTWCYHLLKERRITLRNIVSDETSGPLGGLKSFAVQDENLSAGLEWSDLERIRARWNGPMVVKGILDADDAAHAVDVGADGVVVSNHGGRQLNPAQSTLEALPAIAEKVRGRTTGLLDGDIRTGGDVVVALALGADACLIGRPAL